jgi:hypothetical protein
MNTDLHKPVCIPTRERGNEVEQLPSLASGFQQSLPERGIFPNLSALTFTLDN